MLSETHNIVEAYLHVSIFQPTLRWQDFSWKWHHFSRWNILNFWMKFICFHLDIKVELSIICQLHELSYSELGLGKESKQ
jgi:hypothetical protein